MSGASPIVARPCRLTSAGLVPDSQRFAWRVAPGAIKQAWAQGPNMTERAGLNQLWGASELDQMPSSCLGVCSKGDAACNSLLPLPAEDRGVLGGRYGGCCAGGAGGHVGGGAPRRA